VAQAEGGTRQSVFAQLLAIAADNVAVARALLRWKSDGRASFYAASRSEQKRPG
jgi:hypothetical protein